MSLGDESLTLESWDVKKLKGKKKKDDEDCVIKSGCCIKLRFIGRCISSRSKVDGSISEIITHDKFQPDLSVIASALPHFKFSIYTIAKFVREHILKMYPPNMMEKFQINWAGYLYNCFLKEKMSK